MLSRRAFLSDAFVALGAAACSRPAPGGGEPPAGGPAAAGTARPSSKRIALKGAQAQALCTVNWYIAVQKGFFAAEGLDVELLRQDRSLMHAHLLQSNWLSGPDGPVPNDVLTIEYPALAAMAAGDINYYVVAGDHSGCRQIVCPIDSPIAAVGDLRGRRIAIQPNEDTLIWELLIGATPGNSQPQWIRGPFAVGDPQELAWVKDEFAARRIDAYISIDPTCEILVTEGVARRVASNTWTAPLKDWYCCMVAIRKELVDAHPELPKSVTRALRQASTFVQDHPADAVALAVASGRLPSSVDQALYARLLGEYVWTTTGRIKEDLERYFELLIDAGRLPAGRSASELVAGVYRSGD